MNYIDHANNSAIMFGGKPEDYLSIHKLIDMNKQATRDVTGRFFLHSYDVGLTILKKVFPRTKNLEQVLVQHLFEDYGRVITFQDDWLPAFDFKKMKTSPALQIAGDSQMRRANDPLLQHLTEDQAINLAYLVITGGDVLPKITGKHKRRYYSKNSMYPFVFFGNSLGVELATKVFGEFLPSPEQYGLPAKTGTEDIFVRLLNTYFEEGIPSFGDFQDCIIFQDWMAAPNDATSDRKKPEATLEKVNGFLKSNPSKTPQKYKFDLDGILDDLKEKERKRQEEPNSNKIPFENPRFSRKHRLNWGKRKID